MTKQLTKTYLSEETKNHSQIGIVLTDDAFGRFTAEIAEIRAAYAARVRTARAQLENAIARAPAGDGGETFLRSWRSAQNALLEEVSRCCDRLERSLVVDAGRGLDT